VKLAAMAAAYFCQSLFLVACHIEYICRTRIAHFPTSSGKAHMTTTLNPWRSRGGVRVNQHGQAEDSRIATRCQKKGTVFIGVERAIFRSDVKILRCDEGEKPSIRLRLVIKRACRIWRLQNPAWKRSGGLHQYVAGWHLRRLTRPHYCMLPENSASVHSLACSVLFVDCANLDEYMKASSIQLCIYVSLLQYVER
jgi:hypothetical protein